MCDAADYAVKAVLGQKVDRIPYVIYYASMTLNEKSFHNEREIIQKNGHHF